MKTLKTTILILLLAILSTACKKNELVIVLTNDTSVERVDEAVTISRADLEKQNGKIPMGFVPMLVADGGDVIPSQVDDLNGDGEWDELFTLVNIPANSSLNLKVAIVKPKSLPSFTQRSNAWLASPLEDGSYREVKKVERPKITRENHGQTSKYFQFEGPGWENDRVGFRNYFDERNGNDIFGKRTPEMVLQNVGVNEDYHALQDWGMDILKVGASLGAGSIAVEINGTLHRVGPNADGSYELVSNGPLRSIFRLKFENWIIEDLNLSVVHEISIHGGVWYYDSKVTVTGVATEFAVVTGITTIDLKDIKAQYNDYENGVVSLSTHDKQTIEGEFLGMAVMLASDNYIDHAYLNADAKDINHTYALRMKTSANNPVSYRFYSAWELSDNGFSNSKYFEDMLKRDALCMAQPVKVSFK